MIKVITDGLRTYFNLSEEECKKYYIPTDIAYLEKMVSDLSKVPTREKLLALDMPITQVDAFGKWVVTETTETDLTIDLDLTLLKQIYGNVLICTKVESGRYHILSELAKKWFICTNSNNIPKRLWIKY